MKSGSWAALLVGDSSKAQFRGSSRVRGIRELTQVMPRCLSDTPENPPPDPFPASPPSSSCGWGQDSLARGGGKDPQILLMDAGQLLHDLYQVVHGGFSLHSAAIIDLRGEKGIRAWAEERS